jgi:hypothetical protein
MQQAEKAAYIAALKAWQDGKTSDVELELAIDALDTTIVTMQALGANWVATSGLQTSLTSMMSARDMRRRDRRSYPPHVSQAE